MIPAPVALLAHKLRAIKAAFKYGFPAGDLIIIGVAGTKGKTTTCNLIARILEENGKKVAMFSTANIRVAGEESLNYSKMTTPSPEILQSFLAKAVKAGCRYAVIETSSHGLKQNRHWGIDYNVAVVTNLMADHLDYHKTAEDYRDTHLKMIGKKTYFAIINGEDKESVFLREKIINSRIFTLGLTNEAAELKILSFGKDKKNEIIISEIKKLPQGTDFNIVLLDENLGKFSLKIPGEFNAYNALGAIGAAFVLGAPPDKIKAALKKAEIIPGRVEEIIAHPEQDFRVIVDYAHSPDSLKTFYEAIVPSAKGKVIAVLGGTGDRDKTYRAKMGALADECADIAIITNEDPYSEDPETIIDQVLAGVKNKKLDETVFRISDRREAIEKAAGMAKKGDLILITGKGAEQCIVQGEKKIPWDDRKAAREALEQRFLK